MTIGKYYQIIKLRYIIDLIILIRNPTPEKTPEIPVKWKPVGTSKLEYLHIGSSKDVYMAENLFPDRVNFWASIPHSGNIELVKDVYRTRDEL